jgi:toxin YoeB
MMYELTYEDSALKDIKRIKKSGNKSLIKKLEDLLCEIAENPRSGTGQPEQLKHYPFKQTWSRRLNQEYRLVYEIHDEIVTVKVISAADHYGDK